MKVSVTEWLERRGMPAYGAEGCTCGNTATPSADCPHHYFVMVIDKLEECVGLLLDARTRTPENMRSARILIGLEP